MAVAVKNTPEAASSGLLARMPVVSILGAVYALGCLGIIFSVLPSVWRSLFASDSFVSMTLLGLVMLGGAFGLILAGERLLTARAVPGVRAGIFMCLMGFVLILLLTRWASLWIEHWVYDLGMFGASGPSIGALLCAATGLALLLAGGRLLLRPQTEQFLVRLEQQGWFSPRAYKPLQGQRVRRGTIFGLLILAGCGIYTLISHNFLQRGPRDWRVQVPFTERITIENPGDAAAALKERFPDWSPDRPIQVDRSTLRDINAQVDPARYVRITQTDLALEDLPNDWRNGKIVPKSDYEAILKKVKARGEETTLKAVPTQPATGTTSAASLTLLPAIPFTVPLLLVAASLWLAWRVVNLPVFADFLIATDAEMNKVSWITQRRLVQDTIVVLVTVVVLTLYLFAMDQTWRVILSWKPIGVLQFNDDPTKTSTNMDENPW